MGMLEHILGRRKQNILILGSTGMLGKEVLSYFNELSKDPKSCIGHVWTAGFDISDQEAVRLALYSMRDTCDYVVNCAAFTDTAKCQDNNDGTVLSYKANVLGPKHLAQTCAFLKIKLIHISTDYVYSEHSPKDGIQYAPFPLSTYGLHKLLGEKMVESAFSRWPKGYMILRTAWLYGPSSSNINGQLAPGKPTFIQKFLLNCYKTVADFSPDSPEAHPVIHVQSNSLGRPTSTWFLSSFIANAIELQLYGTMDAQQAEGRDFGDGIMSILSDPISRDIWAAEILKLWKSEDPTLADLEVEGTPMSQLSVPRGDVRHPLSVPKSLYIQHYIELSEDYEKAIGAASSWKEHTKKFLEIEKDSIKLWISQNLTDQQKKKILEIQKLNSDRK